MKGILALPNTGRKTILENCYEDFKPFLNTDSQNQIEKVGLYSYYRENKTWGTSLMEHGACVFMNKDEHGIAVCGIEQAYKAGACEFQKPISCHLYPIRSKKINPRGLLQLTTMSGISVKQDVNSARNIKCLFSGL